MAGRIGADCAPGCFPGRVHLAERLSVAVHLVSLRRQPPSVHGLKHFVME